MPLLTDLSLAMRTDPLALIRGATEFVTVIYGPAVTFAFPDVKVEASRRSVLHLNLISAVDGNQQCENISEWAIDSGTDVFEAYTAFVNIWHGNDCWFVPHAD